MVAALGSGVLIAWGAYWSLSLDLPGQEELKNYQPKVITEIYSDDGVLVGELADEYRKVVPPEKIPPYLINAFVAVEDARFFEHKGLDYYRLAGALYHNIKTGDPTGQGASTITMQLARTFFFTQQKLFSRKFKEMILAWRIDHSLKKDYVLWLYLNQIYLGTVMGRNIYGVEAASEQYFGKSVNQLTLAEAAMLAGLPRWPARYSPYEHFNIAKERQKTVLRRMVEVKMLTAEEAKLAESEPIFLRVKENQYQGDYAYFIEAVHRYLVEAYGEKRVMTQGLKVFTTMNPELQKAGMNAVVAGLAGPEGLDHREGYRGPVAQVAKEEVEKTLQDQEEKLQRQWRYRNRTTGGDPLAQPPVPVPLSIGAKYLGLITAIDGKENRVGIGIGSSKGWIAKADCNWALRGRTLDKVFSVGDQILVSVVSVKVLNPGSEYGFRLEQEPAAEAGLLAFSVRTGEVKAIVGGYSFSRSQLIRPSQSFRQPGSAFKPILYASALDHPTKGFTPATIIYDSPDIFQYTQEDEGGKELVTWKPENYAGRFLGPRTLRKALEASINTISVKIAGDVGIEYACQYARKLGIKSPLRRDLTTALGSSPVSLLELTRAYNTFASGGYLIEPYMIRRVYDRQGNLLEWHERKAGAEEIKEMELAGEPGRESDSAKKERFKPVKPSEVSEPGFEEYLGMLRQQKIPSLAALDAPAQGTRIISPQLAYLMNSLLEGVALHGTGWRAGSLGRPVAGKTGTTNEFRDAWFIGYSPEIICGVWVGFDDYTRTLGPGEAGAKAAEPIWLDFMGKALAGKPAHNFPVPDSIEFARIDEKTGLLASSCSNDTRIEAFIAGTAPLEASPCGPNPKAEDMLQSLDRY